MVKTSIDIKTKLKAKNIEAEEYEKIMNVWRACMLFFEREIRKLNDRSEISSETLRKIVNHIDFTDLLRMNFLSIKDQDRMRIVKLSEVAEAIQKVQQMYLQQSSDIEGEAYQVGSMNEFSYPEYENIDQSTNNSENYNIQGEINPISNILNQEVPNDNEKVPEIHAKDHLQILQRNTASSVVELRRLMYQNIQKIREALSDEST